MTSEELLEATQPLTLSIAMNPNQALLDACQLLGRASEAQQRAVILALRSRVYARLNKRRHAVRDLIRAHGEVPRQATFLNDALRLVMEFRGRTRTWVDLFRAVRNNLRRGGPSYELQVQRVLLHLAHRKWRRAGRELEKLGELSPPRGVGPELWPVWYLLRVRKQVDLCYRHLERLLERVPPDSYLAKEIRKMLPSTLPR